MMTMATSGRMRQRERDRTLSRVPWNFGGGPVIIRRR
jgi:hypothetical protein